MKIAKTRAIALAVILLELEIDSICNDAKDHFAFSNWSEKFGPQAYKLAEKLTSSKNNSFNATAIEKIAGEIQRDFESGYWPQVKPEDGLYNYMMPTQYGESITQALEMQLAMLTGVGVQQELKFA